MRHQLEDIPIAPTHVIRIIPVFLVFDLDHQNTILYNNVIRRLITLLRCNPYCLECMMLSIIVTYKDNAEIILHYDELCEIMIPSVPNNYLFKDCISDILNNELDKNIIRTAGNWFPQIIIITNKSDCKLDLSSLWDNITNKIILTSSKDSFEHQINSNVVPIIFEEIKLTNYLLNYLTSLAEREYEF